MYINNINRKVCIIGGGPAGLSCALWMKYLGMSPIILEKKEKLGGLQHFSHYTNTWYMGVPGKPGPDFIKQFIHHAEAENLPTLFNATPDSITKEGDDFCIKVGRTVILARAIVICTGQRIRRYDSIQSIAGNEILKDSAQVCFNPGATPLRIPALAGQQVAIVGGGDNGLGGSALMSSTAEHIHLIVRSEIRGFGLYKQMVIDGIKAGKITLYQPAQIERFESQQNQIGITLRHGNGELKTLLVDFIGFRLGFSPNVEEIGQLLQENGVGTLELTPTGYIQINQFCRTSLPRIYAAGDVSNQRDACVATAVAQGAIAARSVEEDLRSLCWQSMEDSSNALKTKD